MIKRATHKIAVFLLLLILIFPAGCTRKKKKNNRLQKLETELWTKDKNGCTGDRMSMKNQLLGLKHNMRGLKASDIESYLGKPDAQELYNRSQRYYIYFMEPGPKCDNAIKNPQALFVRFSAVGVANEFTIKPI